MRKIMLSGCLVAALMMGYGCGSNQQNTDAVEAAEESNEKKAEAAEDAVDNNAQTAATNVDHMEDDAEFAVKAANGGMMEVELARLASTKATSQEVKTFAKHMMEDHMKANSELQALATQKNITLPAALGEEAKKDVDRLSKLTGAEFDKEYMDFMVEDHQEDVDDFRKASQEVKDAEIKAFAAKTLPKLEEHLQMAKKAKEVVDKMDSRASMK